MKQQQSTQIRDILKIEQKTRKHSLREFTHKRDKNYNFSEDQISKFADILALENKSEQKQIPRFGSLPNDNYLKVFYDFNINSYQNLNLDFKGLSKLSQTKSHDFELYLPDVNESSQALYLPRVNESSQAQEMTSQDTSFSGTDFEYSDVSQSQSQSQSQTQTSKTSQVSNLKVELEALEENLCEGLQELPSFRDHISPVDKFDEQVERKLMEQWQYVDQKYREGELDDMYGGDDENEDEYAEFDREVERSLSFGSYVEGGLISQAKKIYQQHFGSSQEQYYDDDDDDVDDVQEEYHVHGYEYDEYDQPITEQDCVGEYNNHNFRFDDKKHRKSQSSGMMLFHDLSSTGLEDIPEEEEEEQLQEVEDPFLQFDSQDYQEVKNRRMSIDTVTPEASRTPGLNLEVINLELETALQDAEQQVASLRTQLRNKDIQVGQLQTALLSYGEQQLADIISNNEQHSQASQNNNSTSTKMRSDSPREIPSQPQPQQQQLQQQQHQHRTVIRSRDVLEKVMERSMRIMESQHKREMQKMKEEIKSQDDLIEQMRLERDHLEQDVTEMQCHYEDQIKTLEQHTDTLIIEQDALEEELQQALRELQKSHQECDHLAEKLSDANRLIQTLTSYDTSPTSMAESFHPQTHPLPPPRIPDPDPCPQPHPSPDIVFSETTTFGSVQSSSASPIRQGTGSPNGVCNYLNEEIKKQISNLSQTTDCLVRRSSDLQETLARCRQLDMNVERCVAAACAEGVKSSNSTTTEKQQSSENKTSSTNSKVNKTSTTTFTTTPTTILPHKLFAHAKKKLFKKRGDTKSENKGELPQAVEVGKHDDSNLKELQTCVQELQENLRKAVKTADGLTQQKLLLHQRIRILETCLKSQSQPDQCNSIESKPSPEPPSPIPECQTLEEAMEYISRIHQELSSTKKQLHKSEQDKKELVQTLAQIGDQKIQVQEQQLMKQQQQLNQETMSAHSNLQIGRSSQLPTLSSVGSDNPDAIQIAEEMSKKVVVLQSEKEELEEALNQMKLDNQQLKQVKEQLELQVTSLVQYTNGGAAPGKRRLGGLLRGMGKT